MKYLHKKWIDNEKPTITPIVIYRLIQKKFVHLNSKGPGVSRIQSSGVVEKTYTP